MQWLQIAAMSIVLTGSAFGQSVAGFGSLIRQAAELGRPHEIHNQVVDRLDTMFLDYTGSLDAYATRVRTDCRNFPEADLYPYALPALAMHHQIAAGGRHAADRYRRPIEQLTDRTIMAVAGRMNVTPAQLRQLHAYGGYGCHLANLNLLLAANERYLHLTRHQALRVHVSQLLIDALTARAGKPIHSYPTEVWPIDTAIALVSLKVADDPRHRDRVERLIDQHLNWLKTTGADQETNLPYSQYSIGPGSRTDVPRGSALSWHIAMISELDPDYAAELYERYCRTFWRTGGPLTGFAEYPPGVRRADNFDSGPSMFGLGGTASALGFAATQANNDVERTDALRRMIGLMPALTGMVTRPDAAGQPTISGMAPADDQYVSGFLYGDITLYYAMTWRSLTPDN